MINHLTGFGAGRLRRDGDKMGNILSQCVSVSVCQCVSRLGGLGFSCGAGKINRGLARTCADFCGGLM